MNRITSLPLIEHRWHFADGSRGSLSVGSVIAAVGEAMPRKPRLKWPRDIIQWFAVIEQHPDRLGVFADWLEEREGCEVAAMLAPAVRFAFDSGRWPSNEYVTVPIDRYFWIVTNASVIPGLIDPCWVSAATHRFTVTRRKQIAVGLRRFSGHRSLRVASFLGTRPVKLPDAFRYLAILLDPEPPA